MDIQEARRDGEAGAIEGLGVADFNRRADAGDAIQYLELAETIEERVRPTTTFGAIDARVGERQGDVLQHGHRVEQGQPRARPHSS